MIIEFDNWTKIMIHRGHNYALIDLKKRIYEALSHDTHYVFLVECKMSGIINPLLVQYIIQEHVYVHGICNAISKKEKRASNKYGANMYEMSKEEGYYHVKTSPIYINGKLVNGVQYARPDDNDAPYYEKHESESLNRPRITNDTGENTDTLIADIFGE